MDNRVSQLSVFQQIVLVRVHCRVLPRRLVHDRGKRRGSRRAHFFSQERVNLVIGGLKPITICLHARSLVHLWIFVPVINPINHREAADLTVSRSQTITVAFVPG